MESLIDYRTQANQIASGKGIKKLPTIVYDYAIKVDGLACVDGIGGSEEVAERMKDRAQRFEIRNEC